MIYLKFIEFSTHQRGYFFIEYIKYDFIVVHKLQ